MHIISLWQARHSRIFSAFGAPWRNEPSIHFNFDFPLFFGISNLIWERYDALLDRLEREDTRKPNYFLDTRYYPGWDAYVDGEPAKLWRVDYLLQGVFLPAGEHQVVIRYDPLSVKIGAALSAIGFLIVLVAVGFHLKALMFPRVKP